MPHSQKPSHGIDVLLFTYQVGVCRDVTTLLKRQGIRVTERLLDAEAARQAECLRPDLILLTPGSQDIADYQRQVRQIESTCHDVAIVLVADALSEEMCIVALRLGLKDFLRLPADPQSLIDLVERWTRGHDEGDRTPEDEMPCAQMVGESDAMLRVKSYIRRAAVTDCTVLITGETGTGKELAAEYIHQNSARRDRPFVCVNCAAIPDSLLESELFGHTRGAFTGADSSRDGLLVSAEGGTILLDEIGDMSLSAQAKILRVLEKKEVSRLGSAQPRRVDIRFVAATNQDLETMAERGTFRKDLFYRLNAARVELPPLRERREDIPLLINHYRNKLGRGDIAKLSEECMRRLQSYRWPGNIRELKNVIENILIHCTSTEVRLEDLPIPLNKSTGEEPVLTVSERERLVNALCTTQWNKSRAAEALRWSRMTLYRKMAKYQIDKFPAPQV